MWKYLVLNKTFGFKEVTVMQNPKPDPMEELKIYSLRISKGGPAGTSLTFRHTGDFRLNDYEDIELTIADARLVRRNGG